MKQQKSRIDKLEKRLVPLEKAKSNLDAILDEIFADVKNQLSYIQVL
ncbi:MAG: hypothetical protein KGI28_02650 [Thaumarchaeota archaeon]|nr:hypothetical protein [Nitrososphaerota archaeon]